MVDHTGRQFGHYTLIRLLGSGGFAEVYLGEHIYLKSFAAIKVLLTALDQAETTRFQVEARTLATLKHPHIVRTLDFGIEQDTPFLVMEYASNGTMQQRHPRGVPLTPDIVIPYVSQIASALQYAHDHKLIHRDIKPGNILLQDNNELLLSDFGVAMFAHDSQQKSGQGFVGTATYMAPEQIRGQASQSSDQYALGVMVYEWLSGGYLFQGSFTEVCSQHIFAPPESLRSRVPHLSPAIEQVVMKALAKEPAQRFTNVQAFATTLEQVFLSEQITVPSLPNGEDEMPAPLEPQGVSKTIIPPVDVQAEKHLSHQHYSLTNSFATTLQTLFSQHVLSSPRNTIILLVLLVAILGSGLSYYVYAATGHPAAAQKRNTATQQSTQVILSQNSSTPTAAPSATPSTQVDLVVAPTQTNAPQPIATPTSKPAATPTSKATPTPRPACPPLIESGSKNTWVKTLQQDLNKRGMTDPAGKALVVDGDFGANTQYAVKNWQKQARIEVDGAVGPQTWHSLGRC